MCEPHRILRRTLTVPPPAGNSNNTNSDTTDMKSLKTKSTSASFVNNCESNVLNNSSKERLVNVVETQNKQVLDTNLQTTEEFVNINNNALRRRKSYESLDVIDGRAMTPVNTTARQRLLKVNSDIVFPKIQIQKKPKEITI